MPDNNVVMVRVSWQPGTVMFPVLSKKYKKMKNISEILKKEDAVVVDVRNTWEYDEGHVKNAVNIPLTEIPARIDEFKKLNGPVILYCRSGNRSGAAVHLLKQAGITNVYNGGGIFDLQKITLN